MYLLWNEPLQLSDRPMICIHMKLRLQLPDHCYLPLQCFAKNEPVRWNLALSVAQHARCLKSTSNDCLPNIACHLLTRSDIQSLEINNRSAPIDMKEYKKYLWRTVLMFPLHKMWQREVLCMGHTEPSRVTVCDLGMW